MYKHINKKNHNVYSHLYMCIYEITLQKIKFTKTHLIFIYKHISIILILSLNYGLK